jgi:cytochrome P450
LIGEAPPSPAGPVGESELHLPEPPAVPINRYWQALQLNQRQIEFMFRWRRRLGDVFRAKGLINDAFNVTSHPDHVKSLFTAAPELVPSLTAESPLLPIVGPNSILTANGPRHIRQRKLLLPAFHGDAIANYVRMIGEVTEREIERWPLNKPIALAPRMQEITLEVIMAGIFGVGGRPPAGTPADGLRRTVQYLTRLSTLPIAQVSELMNLGAKDPRGALKQAVGALDRHTYAIIRERRSVADLDQRDDILSLIMRSHTEDGEPLTDRELRDELLTLVLAGFETTANSLAWAWERLTRNDAAYDQLRQAVRDDDAADEWVEATINETLRSRPVVPIIGRRVAVPWQLGEYVVPAGSAVTMSTLLVHHREDLYPDPFSFRPERWIGEKPGTYSWIPFGGGTRRCLGASLAMAEMRVVLRTMARRLEIEAADPAPERARHRNVTMLPEHGARAIIRQRYS